MKTSIVIGLSFGDEGKGLVTDYLTTGKDTLVVRFSGGQQAGHTVVTKEGIRHIFSNFGSGTLKGAATYWSKYCTFYPIGMMNEYKALTEKGIEPVIYVDGLSMVTTPLDVIYNRALETSRDASAHGSCGVGIGTTVERNETPYKLHVQDLAYPTVLKEKLIAINNYYTEKVKASTCDVLKRYWVDVDFDTFMRNFKLALDDSLNVMKIVNEHQMFDICGDNYKNIIFEGSQGIMLDMDFGFFPNVTRSNVTSKNAIELVRKLGLNIPEIFYVTRCYQTRHGAGSMTNEHLPVVLKNHENETNVTNDWQGNFRTRVLDADLLSYAINSDANFADRYGIRKNLVITCMDQVDNFKVTKNGELHEFQKGKDLGFWLIDNCLNQKIDNLYGSHHECADKGMLKFSSR